MSTNKLDLIWFDEKVTEFPGFLSSRCVCSGSFYPLSVVDTVTSASSSRRSRLSRVCRFALWRYVVSVFAQRPSRRLCVYIYISAASAAEAASATEKTNVENTKLFITPAARLVQNSSIACVELLRQRSLALAVLNHRRTSLSDRCNLQWDMPQIIRSWRTDVAFTTVAVCDLFPFKQELSYRKQIARQLRTLYLDGINSNPVTL